jgi:hypothetical protein
MNREVTVVNRSSANLSSMSGWRYSNRGVMSAVQVRKREALAQVPTKAFILKCCLSASLDPYRDLDQ